MIANLVPMVPVTKILSKFFNEAALVRTNFVPI
jgi:hypothetical protein